VDTRADHPRALGACPQGRRHQLSEPEATAPVVLIQAREDVEIAAQVRAALSASADVRIA
jgi:hypothetical protein